MAIEVHFEKRFNNAAVIRDVDVQQQREYVLLTLLAACFVLGLLFYGWQQYRWIQAGYAIEAAQKRQDELKESNGQLTLERDSLATLQRIDSIARHDLGMVAAVPGQLVTLNPAAPLTIPSAPEPASPALNAKNESPR
jgi:cell division protein FtsL